MTCRAHVSPTLIIGNHEIMNVLGDFRYATKGAYEECARYSGAG
jgi:hypothetical protein